MSPNAKVRTARRETDLARYSTILEAIGSRRTDLPLLCLRPRAAAERAYQFALRFPGVIAYPVKAEPHTELLQAIASGVERAGKRVAFDVASLNEIRLAKSLFPNAALYFMHPFKKQSWIDKAYRDFHVRHYTVDDPLELDKFLHGRVPCDVVIFIRVAFPPLGRGPEPAYKVSGKFGADPEAAISMLRTAADAGFETGLAFHVGSQCLSADPWIDSIDRCLDIVRKAGVRVSHLDVGGGFPGIYSSFGSNPHRGPAPSTESIVEQVAARLRQSDVASFELIAEPGRALVFDSVSVVTQVIGRKASSNMGDRRVAKPSLYIDDGVWSLLSESLTASAIWPVRWHMKEWPGSLTPYYVGGVTCDSEDVLAGEYNLPENIAIGDFIEFGSVGAYGSAIRSQFNGFGEHECAVVDEPFVASASP